MNCFYKANYELGSIPSVLKEKQWYWFLMLVSLNNPKPVFYSLQPRANKQYNESGAVSKRPLPPHQNNPTAGDRGAIEQRKQTKLYGKRGEQRDMQNQTPTKLTFNSAEKCKTLDIKCQRAR